MRSYWRDVNVLVTGANGFLGSWLARKLVDEGATVVCLLRDQLPQSLFNLDGTFERVIAVHGALEDYVAVERIFNEFEVDICFHLAAQALVGTAERNPMSTYESNIRGTYNILEAVRRGSRVRSLLVASSDKVYGEKETLPYAEEDALAGRSPYDVSKVCADLLAQSYVNTYELPLCIVRSGNYYGPGDLNFSRLIPGTIRSLIKNEPPMIRSDGRYVRDYFYIEDAADAYLALAEKMADKKILGQVFNFGTETPTSVIDVVRRLIDLSGKRGLKPVILNQAAHEIRAQYLSCRKARALLGWRHKTSLEEGLKKTYAWYRRFLKSPRPPVRAPVR